jgi:TRAP-type C4-dicarboxylate transport system permease small subunit
VPAVKVLAGAVEAACLGLTVVLVADVAVGVFSRYVLQNTFRWYDEIARLCFVWIIFLGAVVAVRRRAHFRLHLLVDRLGPRMRRGADVAVSLCVIAFALILIAGGWAIYPVARRQMTDAMEISMLWFFAALPVGGVLMIVFALPQLWTLLRGEDS